MNIYCIVLGVILITWWSAPLIAWFGDLLVSFWSRGRNKTKWGTSVINKQSNFFGIDTEDDEGLMIVFKMLEAILLVLVFIVVGGGLQYHTEITLIALIAIIALIVIPRFACDIAHSIRYNFKTRDADRIKELEQRLDQLEK